jgi:hypothetical protein
MNDLGHFKELARKWRMGSRFRDDLNPNGHDYAATYLELLSDRPIRKILEIGIGPGALFHPEQVTGAGLHFWSELFPDAHVFGVDKNPALLINEGRIRSYLCDQSDAKQLAHLAAVLTEDASITDPAAGFDLIIDDGSHLPADQVLTANALLPLLSPTGVYVIEDVLPKSFYGSWCPELLQVPINIVEMWNETDGERVGLIDDRLVIIEGSSLVKPVA